MNIDQARELMESWTSNPALRVHMECVAACMGGYADRLETDKRSRWIVCGLLHDFDYEKHPTETEHPFVGVAHLAELGVDTLLDFSGKHHWRANSGRPGQGKQKIGRGAEDLLIKLPPGTLVYDDETGELIVDLDEAGKRFVIAKGGRGGFGNEHFKRATNQTPREATPGGAWEERIVRLELKLIADVGLIGMPNAGKSTFLTRVSKARPKVADYPFTTLEPNLGIAELQGHRRIVFADLPGLIEGAAQGHGLGVRFLRHVERTNLLVHLIDVDPIELF